MQCVGACVELKHQEQAKEKQRREKRNKKEAETKAKEEKQKDASACRVRTRVLVVHRLLMTFFSARHCSKCGEEFAYLEISTTFYSRRPEMEAE